MPLPLAAVGDDGEVLCVNQQCGGNPNTGKNLKAAARTAPLFSQVPSFIVAGDDGALWRRAGGTWKRLNGRTKKNLHGISFASTKTGIGKTGTVDSGTSKTLHAVI